MNDEKRKILVCLVKIGIYKFKISKYLDISKRSLYRYLKTNPISEQKLNNVQIDENSFLKFIVSNYTPNIKIEEIKHNEIKEEIQEVKESNNDIVSEEDMKRAYEKLNEYNRKRGIFN